MASQTNSYTVPEIVTGYPIPSSLATPPSPRRRWWSRPIVTVPQPHVREANCMETMVCCTPLWAGLFTILAVYLLIFHVIDNARCHAKFSIQSIAVSPSSATWHVDFLVKNPSSRYSIYYGANETTVSLSPLNAAVLDTFHERKSRSHTAFSVDFVAEELFADSVSVSNANVSAANWTIGFVAKSPNTGCKISLHTLNARLLRGGEVISKSASLSSDFFVTGGKPNVFFDKPDVLFEKVVMPEVSGDVIWDLRVEILFALDTDALYLHGFLIAVCPAIPVKFTTDPAGKVMGSLLGHMRWCDYEFRENLDSSNSIFNSLRS
ncbi:hypothetical protein ISN45_Aa06g021470 [Arabidopsis thaliana x Arabidopsis arenosa]|uniref:Transmembrane protein n=1 Tax=Arabidopsis thaliana x Arabidopsis arenosa TaxID=1240361 RepID=A0A8T1YYP8_9BRAS|nr:hypothetical protein ISN45_Aa06g021470 [Arabidopsis thaliana x Arabidopsis arenosa]